MRRPFEVDHGGVLAALEIRIQADDAPVLNRTLRA